ncbi:calmodulin-regulated spectrin-associated protein 2 isoform X3 [Clupea harengus]|uniref:Calmodulin-regulated spectrin-associated protein 2 isoform X3 n=1 Tax=Clupea harengus TaxID=7950 RepID=A0A6P3W668_CLUHA|nr:calmodulin-regulated spectrin-associated protein 2 isoform X3 [Clupea harengus]
MGDAVDNKETKRTFIVPAIKSFDHYDFTRAKISCSLAWLVAKAFGSDSIPEDLQEPFYRDQYDQEHLKPPVASLLLSAELYCRAGSLILRSDAAKPLLGHNAVIQALATRGLYVTDQEKLVTERDLCNTPIQMSCHLAMIDTLMMAYTVEMVSVERVLSCVQRYCPLFPDEDIPYDAEDAVTIWLNKVNEHLRDILEQDQRTREAPPGENTGAQKSSAKWYWKLVPSRYRREDIKPRPAHCLPLVDNLLKDNTDGCALAALLHFYCPTSVRLEDICLKETMSLADSLYNLQLVQEFCSENLNCCCHFSLEDMLYASSSIKSNYLVFMAELFWWFEVVKPSFVQPRSLDAKVSEPTQSSTKMAPISKNKPSFMERSCSPEPSSSQPNAKPSALIKRSSSMSYVDGCVGTWPKEKRSSAHGISFEIPFDDEVVPVQPGMTRSASTEGLGFRAHHTKRDIRRNLSFQPVNGQGGYIQEEESNEAAGTNRRAGRPRIRTDAKHCNGLLSEDHTPQPSTPSIEEALKIIHDSERTHGSLPSGSGGSSFYLHAGETGDATASSNHDNDDDQPDDIDSKARVDDGDLNSTSTEVDTGIHVKTEDIQDGQDEDSSLKDYSDMDQDYEVRSCPLLESSSPCATLMGARSLGCGSPASSTGSGIRMTSFAEQKFRKRNQAEGRNSGSGSNTPESSELNLPNATTAAAVATPAPAAGRLVARDAQSPGLLTSPRDPGHILASEMVHLKMKLEEKRRAIEAQKKKVEAAFTRHRQRMGRTAFLNVVRRKGGSTSPSPVAETASSLSFSKPPSPSPIADTPSAQRPAPSSVGGAGLERCKPDGAAPKSPVEDSGAEVDMTEYTRTIDRLNTSLGFLQSEMQRLASQQESIMQMRDKQAWVISPPSQPSPQKQLRELRSSSVAGRGGSVGSLSPILSSSVTGGTGSPRTTHRSPSIIKRKSASFHASTPRTPRPSELKITPFRRMLNTPQSVDSLPHLRRFSPSQAQTTSFAYLGHDSRPTAAASGEQEVKDMGQAPDQAKDKDQGAGAELEKSQAAQAEGKTAEKKEERKGGENTGKKAANGRPGAASKVLSQPASVTATSTTSVTEQQTQPKKDLIEVPLSVLKPVEGQESGLDSGPDGEQGLENQDQKMCCGFFYRDDLQGEEEMAQKRAALLEKRERREREMQQKRQELEAELEQKKEAARLKAEEERQKREEEKARRDYIKNEFLRRKQLKLFEDMEGVIKPRPASFKKKPRPKSMHRDIMESPKPPIKATGSRPRGYSVSSLSLASLNLADNESVQSDKRTPRPDSAEGYLSPCQSVSRNGENWENESTTSSVASNTEYTGPKLYKEPSAKSNKYIIQNALAHCCLAGKVNEGQKNKILEEIEKSESNSFLILFRDSGCQFRSLYTYCPETEEITRLVGFGPKTITLKMIEGLFKYNSDKKQFSHIPAKTMSANVDAITIFGHLWQTKKQGTPKKFV